ncbi:hypothetical protein [Leptolyngbya phage Lbo-JY46]
MKQQEIENYNRLCAEFLGWDLWETDNSAFIPPKNFDLELQRIYEALYVEDLKFHSDWNWIMEVVEAISNKFGEAPLFKEVYQKWLYEDKDAEDFLIFRLSKEALVQAINQFLIWYDKQK